MYEQHSTTAASFLSLIFSFHLNVNNVEMISAVSMHMLTAKTTTILTETIRAITKYG